MSKIVSVQGIGNLEFPDNTDPKIIDTVVKRLLGIKEPQQKKGFLENWFPSVKRTGEIYQQETQQGMDAIKKMVEQPTGKSVLQGGLGALQFFGAPLTAFAKGIVREPIEQIPKALGAPQGVTNFIGELAEQATYFVPYGGLVKKAIDAPKTVLEAGIKVASESLPKQAKSVKKKLEFPPETSDEAIAKATAETPPTKQVLTENTVGEVIESVKEAVKQKWNPFGEKRITQEIIDYMTTRPQEIEPILQKYGMSFDDLIAQVKATETTSGKELQKLSVLAKEVYKTYSNNPKLKEQAQKLLSELPEPTTMDKFMDGFKKLENVRRALLVSQVTTTMRNIASQTGRLVLGSIDDAFQGMLTGVTSGEGIIQSGKQALKGLGDGLDTWTAFLNQFKPSQREKLIGLLDADHALKAKAMMYGSPIQDVILGNGLAKWVNTLNRTQEFFFRDIAFETRLLKNLDKAGVKGGLKGIDPQNIPPVVLEDAANHALEMTFAAMPKSQFGKQWVQMMSNPVFTSLLNPFPRFLWGNAMPFLKDFSPLGFIKAASPKTMAQLASNKPETFAKAASRATIGTILINTALMARNNESVGGEKWYEIKSGDKRIDVRPFAPLSSYLFIAEAMSNPDRIKPADYAQALLSLNRIAGTGLVLTDVIRGKKFQTFMSTMNKLAGEYLGGFTTPVRTFKDIYSVIDPQEAIIRDVRENEFIGPTQRNIPELSQQLPAAFSPLKQGPMKTETPILRQMSGLSIRTKNVGEKEFDRLNFDMSKIYPRTGLPEADRIISKNMSPLMETVMPMLVQNEQYKKMSDGMKKVLLSGIVKEIRDEAKKALIKEKPDLYNKILTQKIPDDLKEVLKEQGFIQ